MDTVAKFVCYAEIDRTYLLRLSTASLLRFRHLLSFCLHLLNHRRDKKTSVELAYLNFNIQTCQVKALPCSILVVEPIGSQTREHLDALNDLTDQDDFLNTLFRLVECQLHEAIGHLCRS